MGGREVLLAEIMLPPQLVECRYGHLYRTLGRFDAPVHFGGSMIAMMSVKKVRR